MVDRCVNFVMLVIYEKGKYVPLNVELSPLANNEKYFSIQLKYCFTENLERKMTMSEGQYFIPDVLDGLKCDFCIEHGKTTYNFTCFLTY